MQSKLWMYSTLMLSSSVFAGNFIDNSTVDLTTRNFYFDRDYQEQSKYPAAKDWTQGFILKANSGYTEGTIGFGIDILATAGFKLDASADYAGTGNLPRDTVTNEPASSYGEIGVTGKSKISKTELKVGDVICITKEKERIKVDLAYRVEPLHRIKSIKLLKKQI